MSCLAWPWRLRNRPKQPTAEVAEPFRGPLVQHNCTEMSEPLHHTLLHEDPEEQLQHKSLSSSMKLPAKLHRWCGKGKYGAALASLQDAISCNDEDAIQQAHFAMSQLQLKPWHPRTLAEQDPTELDVWGRGVLKQYLMFKDETTSRVDNPLLHSIWLPWAYNTTHQQGLEWQCGYRTALREFATEQYAWAIPSQEALSTILSYGSKVVELGSGHGYWASLLAAAGGNVTAVDISHVYDHRFFPETIIQDGASFLREHGGCRDATLLICWGCGMDKALAEFKGEYLAVVGEEPNGCTWWPNEDLLQEEPEHDVTKSKDSHSGCAGSLGPENEQKECLEEDKGALSIDAGAKLQWKRVCKVAIPQWRYINDCLAIFERQTTETYS